MSDTVSWHLHRAAQAHADRPALVDALTGGSLTHSELGRRLAQTASVLQRHGVRPGDVVALVSGNSVDMAVALLGVMAYGAIANPLNPTLSAAEVRALVGHSGARVFLAEPNWTAPADLEATCVALAAATAELPNAPSPPRPEDGALLIYTSGTTGRPKGILLTHRNIVANVNAAADWLSIGPDHRTLALLPLFHTFAIISDLCTALFRGGCAVIAPIFDVSRTKELQQTMHRERINSFSAVPLIFELMTRLGVTFPETLRFCVSGAAPLRPDTVSTYRSSHGVRIIPAYGMTETSCFCTISPPDAIVPASCGVAVGCEIRIVDEHRQNVPDGQIGELLVRGVSVVEFGYFRDDRACYVTSGDERWLTTGDLGYRNDEGYVFIVGRKKNMVIRGGEKVYLEDLDVALVTLEGVSDCASVGVSAQHIDRIVTFVVTKSPRAVDRSSILAHLRVRVGDSKCPDEIAFIDVIPRTATNKVRVADLLERAKEYL